MVRGIVRKIDHLGRVTLPMDYRRSFRIEVGENAPVVMHLVNNELRLQFKPVKAIGLTRFLDDLGRLTLPIEIRRKIGFDDRQEVDMYINGEELCIQKVEYGCSWCGSSEELIEINGHHLCRKCAYTVVDAVMED